jgi:hypothetical protein
MPSAWSVPQTIVADGSLHGLVRVERRGDSNSFRGIVPSIINRSLVKGIPLTLQPW